MVNERYIANRIRELRKSRNLDVETVGAGVGRSGKTVSAWETGRNIPSADMLISICKFFDVDIDYFYPPDVTSKEEIVLTPDEQELLDIMRTVTPEGQKQLLIYARGIASTYSKNNQVKSA